MAGTFQIGEVKVRPGAYSNIQKVGEGTLAEAVDGVCAVLFKADFGPLNKALEISADERYENIFGAGLTTDIIEQVFAGGAKTAVCCRIGSDGTAAEVVLKDDDDNEAVTIRAKYVGAKKFSITVRTMLSDDTKKECIIYDGVKEFEKVTFNQGDDEVASLINAFEKSESFLAVKEGQAEGVIADVSQEEFQNGTDPFVTTESYSEGLEAVETFDWNTICVDTEDTNIHSLLQSYLNRIYEVGQMGMAVVAETEEIPFQVRMEHAGDFNDEKMVYIVNAGISTTTGDIDGYQTAARVAGMIAACPSNKSLTHTVVAGGKELIEKLTQTQIISAEKNGGLVLSMSPSGQVWIDSAINTKVDLDENQDEGWKKIRRTKTRYELIKRAVTQADLLVGSVDNDSNGRATIVSQIQGVGNAMIDEGKLTSCRITESTVNAAEGDSCWFDIDAVDKDSAERIYLTFKFRFSTQG